MYSTICYLLPFDRKFDAAFTWLARGAENKLQSGVILKLDKSLTIEYTFILLVGNLSTRSIRVTCKPRVL